MACLWTRPGHCRARPTHTARCHCRMLEPIEQSKCTNTAKLTPATYTVERQDWPTTVECHAVLKWCSRKGMKLTDSTTPEQNPNHAQYGWARKYERRLLRFFEKLPSFISLHCPPLHSVYRPRWSRPRCLYHSISRNGIDVRLCHMRERNDQVLVDTREERRKCENTKKNVGSIRCSMDQMRRDFPLRTTMLISENLEAHSWLSCCTRVWWKCI